MLAREMNKLINVALEREKADLVIINGTLVNVYTGELLENYSVVVKGERIACVGRNVTPTIGPKTQVIDATGKTIIPGLIDSHTHLAWFYTVDEFLRFAMRGGTTTIISEAIEITFPLGYQGLLAFLESLQDQPVKIFTVVPPLVSISPNCKGRITPVEKLRELLKREDILGLGETYWFSVIDQDPKILELFTETLKTGKKVIGHSAGASKNKLMAYLACGVCSCHEPITMEETIERLRLGIHVLIREGSIRKDLEAIAPIKDTGVNLRRLILTTDGIMPDELVEHGYLEVIVQKAIDLGFDPVTAIQMATLNAAEHLNLDDHVGGIAPGKYADLVIIPDLRKIQAEYVISKGRLVARNGELLVQPRKHNFPAWARRTLRLEKRFGASDFLITVDKPAGYVTVRVIEQITDLVTKETLLELPVSQGTVEMVPEKDILKIAAIDFAARPGKQFTGLIKGFNMKKGAIASSMSWDVTNIMVVGANEDDMALAVNRIIELQGGIVVCANKKVLTEIPLPIGGVISELPMEDIHKRLGDIKQRAHELGVPFQDPNLTLMVLSTPAIPFLRICEEGLINIKENKLVSLFPD